MVAIKTNINDTVRKRMFTLMDSAIALGKVKNMKEWCAKINLHYTNIYQIQEGRQTFTHEQIYKAVKLVGSSVNYVYGL